MNTTTNTTDLAKVREQNVLASMKPKEKVAYFLNQKKSEIVKMLPRHLNPERLMKVAQIAATTTPALAECDVPSLVGAIGQCAQMGLEPNTVLGHAYLVPFNTKRKDNQGNERWVKSVQVIIGYKGLIDLARRSGQIVSIAAHEVCANDKFELVYGLDEQLTHVPAMQDRGGVLGFYAVAKLKDGGHCFEFMSLEQVNEIMLASQSKGKYGPWKDNFIEMGRKTVIRRLAKYLPLSIEFQTAAALDGMADGGKDQRLDEAFEGDYNIIPEDQPAIENESQPAAQFNSGRLTDEEKASIAAEEAAEATAQAHQQADPSGETRQRRRAAASQQSMSME
ncbi:recombinase RecT [Limnobacter litoralis]|uniref:DNA recombination protein RecT n=1 Tax=Limnobacter litoralis TaxID=481366 RepID=A0ABQ5YUU7_9BURK|nr:recombinase RecT [Limnobacter litoralis]GLR26539.1 DNA recombination protein RecT [Limnobacter litoralis]